MKKISLIVLIFCGIQNVTFAQYPANACNEDVDINPYGAGPLSPEWFFDHPYQIYTACPHIFVGLGEIDPKYLLDARTGTGRFKNVKTETVQAGVHFDNYNNNPQQPYPGNSVINGYGNGQTNLFELGSIQTTTNIGLSGQPKPTVTTTSSNEKVFNVDKKGQVEITCFDQYPFKIFSKSGLGAPQQLFNVNKGGEVKINCFQQYPIQVFSGNSQQLFSMDKFGALKIYNKSGNSALIIYKNDGTKAIQVDNNGKLHARQVEVDLNSWPDYVFDKGYQLMSLEQVAKYIAKYKHLPKIPTAIDVTKTGLNLGEMQKLMMEKVEELTIYTIKQNEQIKQLQSQNHQLQSELNSLKNEVAEIKAMLNK